MKEIKVEGSFGGQKYDGEKPDYTLVPPDAYKAVAEVMTAGARKYSKNNWVGLELSRVLAALERHLEAFKSGENYADDSKQHHLAHAIANAMMAYHIAQNFPSQDDRIFTYIKGPSNGHPLKQDKGWEDRIEEYTDQKQSYEDMIKDYPEKQLDQDFAPRPSFVQKRSWLEDSEKMHAAGCMCRRCWGQPPQADMFEKAHSWIDSAAHSPTCRCPRCN
jgi:hypothetical protein